MTGRPFVIGLTGSLAMGKSETVKLFAAEGVMVQDADAVIHALYGKGGAAVPVIATIFPQAVKDGAVDRAALSVAIVGDPVALQRLEALVHPLVTSARADFLRQAAGEEILVLDVPLLFETGLDQRVDAVVVVSAPPAVQRERAFARPGMTPEKFAGLLARQLPDVDKRARAHFVIDTNRGLDHARDQVRSILAGIREKIHKS